MKLHERLSPGLSHGVLACPFTSDLVILVFVCLVDPGDLRHERIVRVGITEHGADRQQHFGDGEGGTPLRPEDVETYAAIAVDVRMVDTCSEGHLWWLEGVVSWEVNGEEEDTALVGTLCGSHDGGLPVE